MTTEQLEALKAICAATLDAIAAAGKLGCPAGSLYSSLMTHGCSFNQFQSLMAGLIRAGKVRQSGQLYFVA